MIATIVILALVFGYAGYVLYGMYQKKKEGKSVGCSCGCASCNGCSSTVSQDINKKMH